MKLRDVGRGLSGFYDSVVGAIAPPLIVIFAGLLGLEMFGCFPKEDRAQGRRYDPSIETRDYRDVTLRDLNGDGETDLIGYTSRVDGHFTPAYVSREFSEEYPDLAVIADDLMLRKALRSLENRLR